jgi:hypothetical protein
MNCSVLVVGMPSPAGCASTKTWKAAAAFVEQRLTERFGPAVVFEYAELFGPDLARHPDVEAEIAAGHAIPPIVIIDGVRRFAGGKLNASAIERAVAEVVDRGSAGTEASSLLARQGARHA